MIIIFKYLRFHFKEGELKLLHKAPEDKSQINRLKILIGKIELSTKKNFVVIIAF